MTRYFYDTEFWERGPAHPIILLSIGVVADDGREFYAVNRDAPWDDLKTANDAVWLRANVLPHLNQNSGNTFSIPDMASRLERFFLPRPEELWAYYSDYDHVVLRQIFGRMIDLPKGMPKFTLGLRQLMHHWDVDRARLPVQDETEHNALHDARWVHWAHTTITTPR